MPKLMIQSVEAADLVVTKSSRNGADLKSSHHQPNEAQFVGVNSVNMQGHSVSSSEYVADLKSSYHQPNEPHYVGINLQVYSVSNINTVLQQFDVAMYINFEYKPSEDDVSLYQTLKSEGKEKDFTPRYQPAFRFPNMLTTSQRELKPYLDGSIYTLLTDGEVDTRGAMVSLPNKWKYMIAARMAMRGTFAEPFELENFPVDCQDLRIIIMSTATSNKQVIVPHFRRDTFVTIDQEFTGLPEWKRHPPICDFILSDEKKSARGYRFSSMVLLIKVSRKSRCHLLRTACLIFCISVSQLAVFAIEPESETLPDRLSIGFTLMLTALVFMFVVEARLPNVPYLTLLDKYIYGSFFSMILVMIGSTVVVKIQDYEQRIQWDHKVRFMAIGLMSVLQIWFACSIHYYRMKEEKKLQMNSSDQIQQSILTPQLRIKSNKLYAFEHTYRGTNMDTGYDKNE